jgi:hypothetical protein
MLEYILYFLFNEYINNNAKYNFFLIIWLYYFIRILDTIVNFFFIWIFIKIGFFL